MSFAVEMGNLNVASTFRRLGAHLIDGFVKTFFFLPVILQAVFNWVKSGQVSFSLYLLMACWIFDFVFKVSCLKLIGATPGKLLFGLRVVPKFAPERGLMWFQALIRVLTDQLAFFLGWGFWSLALLRHDRTHLSDWLAETRVVQFTRRAGYPKRRWILGVVLVVYCSISGWASASKIMKSLELSKGQVVVSYVIPD
jgi:uncharacterized RDD family membrane protein YckC